VVVGSAMACGGNDGCSSEGDATAFTMASPCGWPVLAEESRSVRRPASSRAGPFASETYSRTQLHPDLVVIVVVVVVVVARVMAPADSDAYPVRTGCWYLRAGAIDGDMA